MRPKCRVGNVPTLHAGGRGFKSRPRDRLFWTRFLFFLSEFPANARIVTQIRLRSHMSKTFPVHYSRCSCHSTLLPGLLSA